MSIETNKIFITFRMFSHSLFRMIMIMMINGDNDKCMFTDIYIYIYIYIYMMDGNDDG